MKFFRDKPFKVQTAYLLVLIVVVLGLQFFFLRWKLQDLEELHASADYTRKTQIKSYEIALHLQRYASGRTELSTDIVSSMKDQDQALELLSTGGRIAESKVFIPKVSRLPQISLDNLKAQWAGYKQAAYRTIGQADPAATEEAAITSTSAFSPGNQYHDIATTILLDSQWKVLSKWYDRLIKDIDEEAAGMEAFINNIIIWMVVIDILVLAFYVILFRRRVLHPLQLIEVNTQNHKHTFGLPKNEVGDVAIQVNEVIEQLKDATEFVEAIAEGNLEMNYLQLDPNFAPGKNKLADSLVDMQQKLKSINEEDGKRKWANEGVTKFVEILRSSDNNIQKLGDRIIATLVQYMNVNQGGLYLVNDDDASHKYLELVSLFAFDIKKFERQTIKPGEGFLGQVFLEKETSYITQLPNDYVRITSGLGGTNPAALLIVPLKLDKEVYGVVELASFREFKPHEIAFVERLGETIASTLASVKAADRNHRLLEESKLNTEAMRSQEEEMRQNMEELQATQEEMTRKERDYVNRIEELEAKVKQAAPSSEIESLQAQLRAKEESHRAKVRQLEDALKSRPESAGNWPDVEQLEEALRVNLEALQITQEELDKKKKG